MEKEQLIKSLTWSRRLELGHGYCDFKMKTITKIKIIISCCIIIGLIIYLI